MPEFYIIIAGKIFFSEFSFFGGVGVGHVPPDPVSYVCDVHLVTAWCLEVFGSCNVIQVR